MKELYFLVKWDRHNKEKTWSGVSWGLFCALHKHYDVHEVSLEYTPSIFTKLYRRLLGMYLWIDEIMHCRKHLSSLTPSTKKSVIFQFAEILSDTNFRKTYIFIDCSASYIHYMRRYLPEIFIYSDFQDNSGYCIQKRKEMQEEYFNQCAGIFTMGKWLAQDISSRCNISPFKIHPVGGGINVDATLIDDSQKQGNKILFIGRSFKRKGGYLVLSAFNELRKKYPEIELYVAGPKENPVSSELAGYHYMGDCKKQDVVSLLNKCDIFCMPSYFEAYGLVFIEALTFGLPVIGRNAFEMPYIIENGKSGLLLQEDSYSELAILIERLLTDKRFKEYVREKRQYYLSEYSWDKVAERINNIIE